MSCHVPFPFFTDVRTHVPRRYEGWVGWIDFSLLFFAYMHDWVCILKFCQDFKHVLSWSIYHIVSNNTWLGHNNRSLLIFTSVCQRASYANVVKDQISSSYPCFSHSHSHSNHMDKSVIRCVIVWKRSEIGLISYSFCCPYQSLIYFQFLFPLKLFCSYTIRV